MSNEKKEKTKNRKRNTNYDVRLTKKKIKKLIYRTKYLCGKRKKRLLLFERMLSIMNKKKMYTSGYNIVVYGSTYSIYYSVIITLWLRRSLITARESRDTLYVRISVVPITLYRVRDTQKAEHRGRCRCRCRCRRCRRTVCAAAAAVNAVNGRGK